VFDGPPFGRAVEQTRVERSEDWLADPVKASAILLPRRTQSLL